MWGGAVGCIGLIMRKRWAMPVLAVSLAGIIVQDIGLFLLTDAALETGAAAFVLQGLVLVIAIGLVFLGRKAREDGWVA